MARYEAHLQCSPLESGTQQQTAEELAAALGVELTWLDRRNASMALLLQPQGLSVRLLLEFHGHGQTMESCAWNPRGVHEIAERGRRRVFERVEDQGDLVEYADARYAVHTARLLSHYVR